MCGLIRDRAGNRVLDSPRITALALREVLAYAIHLIAVSLSDLHIC